MQIDVQKFFFTQENCEWPNIWPTTVVDVPSINSFKRKLDEYFKDMDS